VPFGQQGENCSHPNLFSPVTIVLVSGRTIGLPPPIHQKPACLVTSLPPVLPAWPVEGFVEPKDY
jgi:hypothetical protein